MVNNMPTAVCLLRRDGSWIFSEWRCRNCMGNLTSNRLAPSVNLQWLRTCLKCVVRFWHLAGATEENNKTSGSILGVMEEITIVQLPKISQKLCLRAELLGLLLQCTTIFYARFEGNANDLYRLVNFRLPVPHFAVPDCASVWKNVQMARN